MLIIVNNLKPPYLNASNMATVYFVMCDKINVFSFVVWLKLFPHCNLITGRDCVINGSQTEQESRIAKQLSKPLSGYIPGIAEVRSELLWRGPLLQPVTHTGHSERPFPLWKGIKGIIVRWAGAILSSPLQLFPQSWTIYCLGTLEQTPGLFNPIFTFY